MRVPTASFVLAMSLALASCATSNYRFADRGDAPPDVQALERAREQRMELGGKQETLGEASWLPLVAIHGQFYGSPDAEMRKGTRHSELDGYGPIFMFSSSATRHYDEEQRLYERSEASGYVWGLFSSRSNHVRVPGGWRVESDTRALFGLLRWPSVNYVDKDPEGEPASATDAVDA